MLRSLRAFLGLNNATKNQLLLSGFSAADHNIIFEGVKKWTGLK
jgi:hypothetical protein